MAYQVEITPAAKRQIKKLIEPVQLVIVERLEQLAADPRPYGSVKMQGAETLYVPHSCRRLPFLWL